jgi:hypothetical protein
MSGAAEAVQTALVAALGALEVSGVFDGAPARAAYPYAVIGEAVSSDWSHKSGRGREHRLAVTIWDDGASAARLHGLMADAEDAIEGMARDLGGHRVVSLVFLRSRIVRDADGPWAGLIEYRARTLES